MKITSITSVKWWGAFLVALFASGLMLAIPGSVVAQNGDPIDPILLIYGQGDASAALIMSALFEIEKEALGDRAADDAFAKTMTALALRMREAVLDAEQAHLNRDQANEKFNVAMAAASASGAIGRASACNVCGNLSDEIQHFLDLVAILKAHTHEIDKSSAASPRATRTIARSNPLPVKFRLG